MDRADALKALRMTGEQLAVAGVTSPIRVIVTGGVAVMLIADVPRDRLTQDCDLLLVAPDSEWQRLRHAAEDVARRLELSPTWLNRDSGMFAHLLPAGWAQRCVKIDQYGPLDVWTINRGDLIAAKVVSAARRPQDLEDLHALRPTKQELRSVRRHLERLESESVARDDYSTERVILDSLEGLTR